MITFETYKNLPSSHLAIQMVSDLVSFGWGKPDLKRIDETVAIFSKRIAMYLEQNQSPAALQVGDLP